MEEKQNTNQLKPVSSRLYGVNQRLALVKNVDDVSYVVPDTTPAAAHTTGEAHTSADTRPKGTEDGALREPISNSSGSSAKEDRAEFQNGNHEYISALSDRHGLEIRMRGYIAGLHSDIRRGRGRIFDWVNGLKPSPALDFDEVNYRQLRKQTQQVRSAAQRARQEIGRLWFTGVESAGSGEQVSGE